MGRKNTWDAIKTKYMSKRERLELHLLALLTIRLNTLKKNIDSPFIKKSFGNIGI